MSERPDDDHNFGRVFELPDHYPEGFCFGGGKPVQMLMVDWFNPWPNSPFDEREFNTWAKALPDARAVLAQLEKEGLA